MIDRMKDAIDNRLGKHLKLSGWNRDAILTEVVADILLAMREPTPGMKKASYRAVNARNPIEGSPMAVKREKFIRRWRAVIDHIARTGGLYLGK